MEVSKTAAGYCLRVSKSTQDKIGARIASLGTVAALVDRKVHLTTLGIFLNSIRFGYLNAYDGADNLTEFGDELVALCNGAKHSVLIELFGNKLGELTDAEKAFVGLEPD